MSTPSKLKRAPQSNTTPQPTPGFEPLYPENNRIRQEEEAANESTAEGAGVGDSIVYYCNNCCHTVDDSEAANNPYVNCQGEMVLSTL